jgi:hypothetical protein
MIKIFIKFVNGMKEVRVKFYPFIELKGGLK